MPDSAIAVEAIRVVLGGKELLSGVDCRVECGEVVAVLGPNGAGKSTLLRVLAGEITPLSGRVWLGGKDVTKLPLWERARCGLGYVPQSSSVLWDLTVEDNIRTFEDAARVERRSPRERAEALALESKLRVRARDLSGGERRSLELLRALIAEPRVLLCDEPFAAGDPDRVKRIAERLREVAERGGCVVVADHRMSDALALSDRALLLAAGAVEVTAKASEFADHPAVRARYLA